MPARRGQDRSADKDWSEVIERLAAGERTALIELSRLVTTFLRGVRAYDFRDDWDDVIQEVIVVVVRGWAEGRIRESHAIPAFVKTVTRRRFADLIAAKRPQSDESELERLAWSPDESLQSAEIRQLVERLPEKQRQVVEALYFEGLSREEAVERTGFPLGSLKRYQRLALSRLEELLGAPGGGDAESSMEGAER